MGRKSSPEEARIARQQYADELMQPMTEKVGELLDVGRRLVQENAEFRTKFGLALKRVYDLARRLNRAKYAQKEATIIIERLLTLFEKVSNEANLDPLTGLFNRRGFTELLAAFHAQGVRTGFLVSLDIDKFKSINDTYGHICGDTVLQEVAKYFSKNFRAGDPISRIAREQNTGTEVPTAARMGGEEILIFLPGLSTEQAKSAMKKVMGGKEFQRDENGEFLSIEIPYDFQNEKNENARIREFKIPESRKNSITFSGAMLQVNMPDNLTDFEGFLNDQIPKADSALYEAKDSGRNKIYILSEK